MYSFAVFGCFFQLFCICECKWLILFVLEVSLFLFLSARPVSALSDRSEPPVRKTARSPAKAKPVLSPSRSTSRSRSRSISRSISRSASRSPARLRSRSSSMSRSPSYKSRSTSLSPPISPVRKVMQLSRIIIFFLSMIFVL